MTSEQSSFFQGIVSEPESDAPRLRYADFLEEQGDRSNAVRAEFIRVQCALEKLPSVDDQFFQMVHRERQLLEQSWRNWV